jgi:hypothetical protein
MQVLGSIYFAKDDVTNPNLLIMKRDHRNKLTAFNLAAHAVAAGPELHGLALK